MTAPFYDHEKMEQFPELPKGPSRDPDLVAYSYIHGFAHGEPFPPEGDDTWGEHLTTTEGVI